MNADQITMQVAGATVTLPAATLAALWLEKLRRGESSANEVSRRQPPRIGHVWDSEGGIYAGVARGRDLDTDHHLILAEPEEKAIAWKDAIAWTKGLLIDSHRDFTLPTRSEQALLFANVKELFAQEAYWSCEEYAGAAESAWCQDFLNGYQDGSLKSFELRARAVRRVPIE